MTENQNQSLNSYSALRWYMLIAGIGALWFLGGIFNFVQFSQATLESMLASGVAPEEAKILSAFPSWLVGAFGLSVALGFVGCVLIIGRNKFARELLGLSLIASIIVVLGDAAHGLFHASTSQFIFMMVVLAISLFVFWIGVRFRRRLMIAG